MKTLLGVASLALISLFVITTFIPYPTAREQAISAGFSDATIDENLQYSFERRFFFWGATTLEFVLLAFLAMSGVARRWADALLARCRQNRYVAALGLGLIYLVLHELLYLPIGIWRWHHACTWGMSNLEFIDWLRDHYIAFGLTMAWQALLVVGFYTILTWFPRTWWLWGAIGASGMAVAYAFLSPMFIDPLFNKFTPLAETEFREHEPRVKALIAKADVPVSEILVMDASRQSNHSNAYFTGFGSTRRIVLYDTLLKKHTPAEIESILAHELGHWRHDHIVKGILLGTLAAIFGLCVLDRLLRAAVGREPWGIQSLNDPASLYLILLIAYFGSWIEMPIQNFVSRHFERQADRMSLDLAAQPDAFISGERVLAVTNKSNVTPTPWNVWIFSSHPTTVERIRMAEEWREAKRMPP